MTSLHLRSSQFLDGIMFTDTVELNFSVTIDPFSRRKVEFNDELKSTIKVISADDFLSLTYL